jgi:hypothetical protein
MMTEDETARRQPGGGTAINSTLGNHDVTPAPAASQSSAGPHQAAS